MENNHKSKPIGELLQEQEATALNLFNRPTYNTAKVYKYLLQRVDFRLARKGKKMKMHKEFRSVLRQIAFWYANDNRFSGDLNKGLLLRGGCGTGKTIISQALADTILHGQKINPGFICTVDLQKLYINKDEEAITRLKQRVFTIIDDLGVESVEVKNWGNLSEPFNDLFDYRYRESKYTIITTNLLLSEIKERYGVRIYDRFKETINDIIIDYPSYRA